MSRRARRLLDRRTVLRALGVAPLSGLARSAAARDYASAVEVFSEIGRLEAELDVRLSFLAVRLPAARGLAASIQADHLRHRGHRLTLHRHLRLGASAPPSPAAPAPPAAPPPEAPSLEGLRSLAQDLVHAYAEGLPAVKDPRAVDVLARDMVDDARHLALLQMWIEAEAPDA